MSNFPIVSVGFPSTNLPYPVFNNISNLADSPSLEVQPYAIQNGLVNCSFPHADDLQHRINKIVANMEYTSSVGFTMGKCLRIGGEKIAGHMVSLANCILRQTYDRLVMRACFNAIVRRFYDPQDNGICEARILLHAEPTAMQMSVVQGCNAFSTPGIGDNGTFAQEAVRFAAKFPLDNL